MNLITAFEIITLASISLSLLGVVSAEIGDSVIDRKRSSLVRKPLSMAARRAAAQTIGATPAAANNPLPDVVKAA